MNLYFLKKLGIALAESYKAFRPTPAPCLIMTLLVKNEEDVLEENLLFHKAMGVDGFIITDNNSTDRTPDILRRYRERGWVLEVIEERGTDYAQKRWVDRMVWLARTRYGADWVINADADEFWYTPLGDLRRELEQAAGNVLSCEVRNVYPEEGLPWTAWRHTVRPVPAGADYDLSRYSLYGRQTNKVCHRTDGYLQISMGNHKVTMLPRRVSHCGIVVYHYNVRSRRQFTEKMINGGRQLEQRKSRHGGRHWRYFYDLYKRGLLEAEYDRVTGRSCHEALRRGGCIVPDAGLEALWACVPAAPPPPVAHP